MEIVLRTIVRAFACACVRVSLRELLHVCPRVRACVDPKQCLSYSGVDPKQSLHLSSLSPSLSSLTQ
jgi:hypothetical protein